MRNFSRIISLDEGDKASAHKGAHAPSRLPSRSPAAGSSAGAAKTSAPGESLAFVDLWTQPQTQIVDRANLTYGAYVDEIYLPEAQRKHRGYEAEVSVFRKRILPHWRHVPLTAIKKVDILRWLRAMEIEGYKPGTINRALNLFKATLSKASVWEVCDIPPNLLRGVRAVPDHARVERFLTAEESQRLMQAVHASANKMLFPIVGFLLLTGARRSEALGARWRDMELQRSLWTIPLSKSGKPRHVPLSEAAVELLQEARSLALAAGLSGCDYAFVNLGTGQPFADIAHSWGHARRLAGLPDVRMHDLRHSYASALVNSGRSIYEVQKLLGHASVRTTERYAHLANETLLQGAAKVAEHFTLPRRDDLRDAEY